MTKTLYKLLLLAALLFALTACNRQIIDTTYSYDYAYIKLPTGEVMEGKIDSWKDYGDGDQLQVVINGTVYLSNSVNIVLVREATK